MAEDRAEPKATTEANAGSAPLELKKEDSKSTKDEDGPADEAKIGNFWVGNLQPHNSLCLVSSQC